MEGAVLLALAARGANCLVDEGFAARLNGGGSHVFLPHRFVVKCRASLYNEWRIAGGDLRGAGEKVDSL